LDNDGLLSSIELHAFQKYAFNVQLKKGKFKGCQNVISQREDRDVEAVVQNLKFTMAGFATNFDIFICQDRLGISGK